VLLLHCPGGAGVYRLVHPSVQIRDLASGGVDVDRSFCLLPGHSRIVATAAGAVIAAGRG